MISARTAASRVGMTKAGIIRSIHTGKLSATRNSKGEFEIDPAELFRVYAPVSTTDNSGDNLDWQVAGNGTDNQSESISEKVTMLERIIRDKDEQIADLRRRLDTESDERRRLSFILTAAPQPQEQPKQALSWWARVLGRSQ